MNPILQAAETAVEKVLPVIGLPSLPGLGLIPTWLLEDGLKKVADYGVHWIEDPAHLVVFKQHIRDHVIADLKARIGDAWVDDLKIVLDALFGLAPENNVKLVGAGGDVQAIPADAPTPAPKAETAPGAPAAAAPTATAPTPAPTQQQPAQAPLDPVTTSHADAPVAQPPKA